MPFKRKVRYAVVGLGHIAQVAVLPAFRATGNSELVTLVSGDKAKQRKLAAKYRLKNVFHYDEYDDALRSGIDAVYVAVPNHLHKEYTVRALNAGVHVLCEKPMAVTESECREMIQAAERNQRKLMIAYRLHFEEGNLEAISAAQKKRLGELRFFGSEFAQNVAEDNVRLTEPTSRGGGPVYDMGVYCINAARYLFRDEPTKISALSASAAEARFDKTEEMVSAILRFPRERLATFTVSFGAHDVGQYTLVGTKGTLTADPAYEYAEGTAFTLKRGERVDKQKFSKRDQFAAELVYFSDCILKNKEPEPSGMEGLADVRIVEAIYRSIREQKAVELPSFPQKERPGPHQEIHRPAHGKPSTVRAKSPSGD
jgi:predicted dehydrogenase